MSFLTTAARCAVLLLVAGTWAILPAQEAAASKFKDLKAQKESGLISKAVGKKLNYFESKYFTWCTSKSEGVLKKVIKHADKAYQVFAKDAKITGTRRLWGDQKAMICIFANKSDFKRYVRWYSETYAVWSKQEFVKSHSNNDWFTEIQCRRVIACHLKPHDVDFIGQVVPNQIGFLAANRLHFHQNFCPPWFEESTAAWIEAKATGRLLCFTTRSNYGDSPFKVTDKPTEVFKKFMSGTKRGLKNGRFKNLKGLMKPRLGDLSYRDVQKGYAIIDWMRSQPGKYSKFVRSMKRYWPSEINTAFHKSQVTAQAKAFKAVFNMSLVEVDRAVKAHASKLK
ncbi:MAG: hypothetical protein V3W41_05970 [Planctomycetota bacterium]